MIMNNKFSILSPSHNNGQFLDSWLDSILSQKYRPLEVVFVNDRCTDNTDDFITHARPKLESVGIELVYIKNSKRVYCGSSCKIAWHAATGSYFGNLDTDDMLDPDAVSYIMGLYESMPHIAYIYSQFQVCDKYMKPRRKGFCRIPDKGQNLLTMGRKRVHCLSHWRTFSNRVLSPAKVWKDGLRSAVDKYFAYRLEEMGNGLFVDKVLYQYRSGLKNCISRKEKAISTWMRVMDEAELRRKNYRPNIFPIVAYEGP
jgi:glycosyltransferase involved in cell wall biosynthesis